MGVTDRGCGASVGRDIREAAECLPRASPATGGFDQFAGTGHCSEYAAQVNAVSVQHRLMQ